MSFARISIVTPTLGRPGEVRELTENLGRQRVLPLELILVDGAPEDRATQEIVEGVASGLPFECRYVRHGGGTAIQRNVGIDMARGDFIAFVDDDIRLEPDFFERILEVYAEDDDRTIGGVAGHQTTPDAPPRDGRRLRWKIYRFLRLFTVFEPGRYDYGSGYPVNRHLRDLHDDLLPLDFMGTQCAVWRREVFEGGLRFDPFFRDYGILEDAHFSLRAGRRWRLFECGKARCVHLHSPGGRENSRLIARKTAVNYRYVFLDIVPDRSVIQEARFWGVQVLQLLGLVRRVVRTRQREDWSGVRGKIEGMVEAARMR